MENHHVRKTHALSMAMFNSYMLNCTNHKWWVSGLIYSESAYFWGVSASNPWGRTPVSWDDPAQRTSIAAGLPSRRSVEAFFVALLPQFEFVDVKLKYIMCMSLYVYVYMYMCIYIYIFKFLFQYFAWTVNCTTNSGWLFPLLLSRPVASTSP